MQCETEFRVAVNRLQEGPVTTNMGIGQYRRKIADRLVSMNTQKQRDGLRHGVVLQKERPARFIRDATALWRVCCVRSSPAIQISHAAGHPRICGRCGFYDDIPPLESWRGYWLFRRLSRCRRRFSA